MEPELVKDVYEKRRRKEGGRVEETKGKERTKNVVKKEKEI